MRKLYFALLLSLCLMLTLSCTAVGENGEGKKSVGEVQTNRLDEINGKLTGRAEVEKQLLLDQDGIKVTANSLTDGVFGPSLKVCVENNRDSSVTVQVRDLAINDVMADCFFSCDVAPGKKANDEIVFIDADLEVAEIDVIKEIELKFHVFDSDSWDTIFDSEAIVIATTADDSYVQAYDDRGKLALDQNGFKVVIKYLESLESFWGADIFVYIENNSDTDATIQLREMSVNGFMIEPVFSADVLSGKKAYDAITFMESDLIDNSIESIDELEFRFHVFESDSWDTIFDSEPVTVIFD